MPCAAARIGKPTDTGPVPGVEVLVGVGLGPGVEVLVGVELGVEVLVGVGLADPDTTVRLPLVVVLGTLPALNWKTKYPVPVDDVGKLSDVDWPGDPTTTNLRFIRVPAPERGAPPV